MNSAHLEYCASAEWRQIVQDVIIPAALGDKNLGPDVIEIGPGPGFTTDVLRAMTEHLTAVEVDPVLATSLRTRLAGSNVDVVLGDATALALPDDSFSGAASFHMLHHIALDEDQDRALSELARVLQSGGISSEQTASRTKTAVPFIEAMSTTPLDPSSLERRLTAAGFTSIEVGRSDRAGSAPRWRPDRHRLYGAVSPEPLPPEATSPMSSWMHLACCASVGGLP